MIDLFAGPGGLGEGFARFQVNGKYRFRVVLSIEKEPNAHSTLTLRAFYRQFGYGNAPEEYYQYIRGEITKTYLFNSFPEESRAAKDEARLLTLGQKDPNRLIASKIRDANHWILIGGPPCQAYSLVGRSKLLGAIKRETGESDVEYDLRRQKTFNTDPRHQLYKQYLAIIAKHWPIMFVMENVRGILSSKFNNELIFPKILKDLGSPGDVFPNSKAKYRYRIFSLTVPSDGNPFELDPTDFLIQSERYGIPQARHRVILLGVREDLNLDKIPLLKQSKPKTVAEVIGDLPKLTPGVTKLNGTSPYDALTGLCDIPLQEDACGGFFDLKFESELQISIKKALRKEKRGARFIQNGRLIDDWWYADPRIGGVCNHETRSHIKEDLWRYAFASCYAKSFGISPRLKNFPKSLLPKHANVSEAITGQKFGDRFRVQVSDKPSSTITSHISKDGHYFIHYDPKQYRSLTVREAARLQTFPDNYFFEGNRTAQYQQVGNAVPPLLAYQIAGVVADLIDTIMKNEV